MRVYRECCRLADPDHAPVRLVVGRTWGAWATRREAHEEAAEAFDHAVDDVDLLVRTQLTRPAAEPRLARATEVAAQAAHAHAAAGAPARAVLRLERGRARLLTAALRTADTICGGCAAPTPTWPNASGARRPGCTARSTSY